MVGHTGAAYLSPIGQMTHEHNAGQWMLVFIAPQCNTPVLIGDRVPDIVSCAVPLLACLPWKECHSLFNGLVHNTLVAHSMSAPRDFRAHRLLVRAPCCGQLPDVIGSGARAVFECGDANGHTHACKGGDATTHPGLPKSHSCLGRLRLSHPR